MSEPIGLALLIRKYAELAGKLESLECETRAVRAAMTHLNASINLFKNGYDVAGIRPKHPYRRNPYFKKGAYGRVALDVLREVNQPMTARDICEAGLRKQGVEPNKTIVDGMIRAMETCLMKKTKEGTLTVDKSAFPKVFCLKELTG